MEKKNRKQSQQNGKAVETAVQSHGADIVKRLLAHESDFLSFVRHRVGEKAFAEDLLQQSLARALERHHTLQNKESVVAWFYKILRHTIIDYYRTQG